MATVGHQQDASYSFLFYALRMTLSSLPLVFALALLVSGTAESLQAQGQPAMIPVAIATAAAEPFAQMLGGQPRFAVGSVPDGWPTSLLPPRPARVLGGVSYGIGQIVLFDVPAPSKEAMEAFGSLLTRAGWRPGFVDPRRPVMQAGARLYCAESAFLSVAPRDSSAGHTTLEATRISTARGMFSPGCDSSDHTLTLRADVSVPVLQAPDGATAVGQESSVSFGAASFTSTVKSALSADAILEHYAKQLSANGWRLGRRATDNGIAMLLLERQHESQRWFGTLTVGTLGDAYDVEVQVHKMPEK